MSIYKHQKLQEYLNSCIQNLTDGTTPLESENVLSAKFGVSRTTVRRALDELVRLGRCQRIRGKGTFAIPHTVPRKIGLIIYDITYLLNPVTGDLIRGIAQVLEDCGYSLDILASNRDKIAENYASYAQNYAGLLIGAAELSPEVLKALFNLPIPVLSVKNYFPDYRNYAVRIDFAAAGRLAAKHLIARGCRQLGVIIAYEPTMIALEFLEGIKLEAQAHKLPVRRQDILSFSNRTWPERDKLLDRTLQKVDRPHGFICFADSYADALIRSGHRQGLKIPHELQVIGCNHLKKIQRYQPELVLTSLEIPTCELGQYAAKLLLERLNHIFNPVLKICPRLIAGESTLVESAGDLKSGNGIN